VAINVEGKMDKEICIFLIFSTKYINFEHKIYGKYISIISLIMHKNYLIIYVLSLKHNAKATAIAIEIAIAIEAEEYGNA